jgi:hypothetical protein
MSQYWAPHITASSHLPSEYAALHQHRLYLLENLAKKEAQGERLANLLEAVKVKLSAAQPPGERPTSKNALKKSLKSLAYKMATCQRTEKALADNLALLTNRMSFLEQNQWRMANANYGQSTQYGQLDALAANMQNMALVFPITPGFPITPRHSQGFVSPITPIHPYPAFAPASESYQLFSPTPLVQPYASVPYGNMFIQQPSWNAIQQEDEFGVFNETTQVDTVMSPLNLNGEEFVPAQRALSLPSIDQARNTGTGEAESTGLTRQLSLANRGSASLRLQKKMS